MCWPIYGCGLSISAGLLLRLFSYLYDMDVIEEECFFKWKEDVSQEFPGKGQALFQASSKFNRLCSAHTACMRSGSSN